MISRTFIVIGMVLAVSFADFNFLAIGDWGGSETPPYTEKGEVACAAGMGKIASEYNATFTLLLGDNFYSHGISSDEYDHRFKATFEDVYTADSLKNIPFYVVSGNHDHLGNVTAQLFYSNHSSRWTYPDLFYTKTWSTPNADGSETTMQIIFIDTVVLSGNNELTGFPYGVYPGPEDEALADAHWDWIEQQLANSKADYLWAAGHYPVWSGCSHGPTDILVQRLKPLLKKYNATGYFSGHDHCLQYIEDENLHYIVTGAADNCCYANSNEDKCPSGSIKFHVWNSGHGNPIVGGFTSVYVSQDHMKVFYHNADGSELYTTPEFKPRN